MSEENIVLVGSGAKAYMNELIKEGDASKRDLYMINPARIKVKSGLNVRIEDEDYEAHIADLAQSIVKEGFYTHKALQCIKVVENGEETIYVTDGHCRLAAIKVAATLGRVIERVPVVYLPASSSMEDIYTSMYRSNGGKVLTPFELGRVCKCLQGCGLEEDEISERIGKSEAYVQQLLRVQGAPIEIRKAIQSGSLTVAVAVTMLNRFGADAVNELKKAEEVASVSGKKRVTNASLPGAAFKKALKKEAPVLMGTLKTVKSDPAYASLSEDLRSQIEILLERLAEKEQEELDSPEDSKTEGLNQQEEKV